MCPRLNVHEEGKSIAHADIAVRRVLHELNCRIGYNIGKAANGCLHVRAVNQPCIAGYAKRILIYSTQQESLQRQTLCGPALHFDFQSASSSFPSFLSYHPAALLLAVRSSR